MDERIPEGGSARENEMGDDLPGLLREFLVRELRVLRMEQELDEMEAEEEVLHVEQYGDDAVTAGFDFLFVLDWS